MLRKVFLGKGTTRRILFHHKKRYIVRYKKNNKARGIIIPKDSSLIIIGRSSYLMRHTNIVSHPKGNISNPLRCLEAISEDRSI
jgi:hypothetical protein